MLTEKDFSHALHQLIPNPQQQHYLLAVSGGADSMVLLTLFQHLALRFEVAHVNYKLRGNDSDADQQLVQEFCKNHQIKCHLYEVSEKDGQPQKSIQNWARNLRYDFFRKIQQKEKIDFVVTAHHLNDQLETFLINLSRGTGIKGLIGIPADENQMLRPLLSFSKAEIYAFAAVNNIHFREDLSNYKNDYLRNRIRNNTVPELLKISPDFLKHFGETVMHLKQTNRFIEHTVMATLAELQIAEVQNGFIIDRQQLLKKDTFLVTEIIRRLGFTSDEIAKVIHAENGKFFRSKTFELTISRNEIACYRRTSG